MSLNFYRDVRVILSTYYIPNLNLYDMQGWPMTTVEAHNLNLYDVEGRPMTTIEVEFVKLGKTWKVGL